MLSYSNLNFYSNIKFMPELPEVETVKRGLTKILLAKRLKVYR